MSPLAWVVGRGGMLGSHMEAELAARGVRVWRPPAPIRWGTTATSDHLAHARDAFLSEAGEGSWQIYWCAGAGVTSTGTDALQEESQTFSRFLGGFDSRAGSGVLFFASSAGGIYAGSSAPPFDERTPPSPLAPYGHAKLAMEHQAQRWAAERGGRVLIGRIANLFGPGQNIDKPQGLISHLLRAHLLRQPITVYVPLDTTRDYIVVSDASRLAVSATNRLSDLDPGASVTKIIATQRGMTIGAVLGELHRVLRRRPQIVLGTSPAARFQAQDLRLRSVHWPELDRLPLTPFAVGVHQCLLDLLGQIRHAQLRPAS